MLNELVGAYPHSNQRGAACTKDGRYLYLGEGGSIAFLDTHDALGNPNQAGMDDEMKRPPVGKAGVIPARMILDPDAALHPGAGANDLLYIAGGRDGLWAMAADLTGSNWAARIDDSGNLNPATQNGRRWCVDVTTFELDGTKYLAALFQRRNQNRLRIYDLADVRQAFTNSKNLMMETGHEIAPDLQVKLEARPNFTASQSHGGSIALGMHAEEVSTTQVDVYVALGPHGLVKVQILPGFPTPTLVAWGPVFGDGTPIANANGKYDNYEMRLGVAEPIERTEPPVFADVVTWEGTVNQAEEHYLYAGVDHLGWVRFDLSGAWGEGMAVDHQEGEFVINDWGEDQIMPVPVVPSPPDEFTYPRLVEIVDHNEHGPVLVVGMHNLYFWKGAFHYSEGPPYDTNAEAGGTSAIPGSQKVSTALYRLRDQHTWTSGDFNVNAFVQNGGAMLCVPENQPGTGDLVEVFHNVQVDELTGVPKATCKMGVDASGVDPTTPMAPDYIIIRDEDDAVGAHCFTVGHLDIPGFSDRLILTGSAESGSQHDGLLVTTTDVNGNVTFEVETPTPGFSGDREGILMSIVGENECQWPDPDGIPNDEFRVIGNELFNGSNGKWGISVVQVDTMDPGNLAVVKKRVGLAPVLDRFLNPGRLTHGSGTRSAEMDAQYGYLTGVNQLVAFASGNRTPEGLFVLDRVLLDLQVDTAADDDVLDTGQVFPGVELLITHPEYDAMPINNATRKWWKSGENTVADVKGAHGAIFNWIPRFMRVKDDQGGMNQWVLAMPCGKAWYDENWPGIQPGWEPTTYWTSRSGMSMVQFWPVLVDSGTDLKIGIVDDQTTSHSLLANNSPLPRLSGPAPGMAIKVDNVLLQDSSLNMRSYCIVSDWAGRVIIADITEIYINGSTDDLIEPPSYDVWTWEDISPSTLDDLPQNVNAVAVDRMDDDKVAYLYVGIRRTGVQVLKFEPSNTGSELTEVELIQTPGNAWDVIVRPEDGTRPKQLFVADLEGGIRVYGEGQ